MGVLRPLARRDRELSRKGRPKTWTSSTTRRTRPPARARCRSRACCTSSRTTSARIRRRSSSASRPGREVRLRCAYFITCTGVVKNAAGEIVELRCTYDPATRGGDAPDGRKVKATLHWVSAAHAWTPRCGCTTGCSRREAGQGRGLSRRAESRVARDRARRQGRAVRSPARRAGTRFQFERIGYFCVDSDTHARAPGVQPHGDAQGQLGEDREGIPPEAATTTPLQFRLQAEFRSASTDVYRR